MDSSMDHSRRTRITDPDRVDPLNCISGLDHERLTYPFEGRTRRLTDVFGNVVKEIIW